MAFQFGEVAGTELGLILNLVALLLKDSELLGKLVCLLLDDVLLGGIEISDNVLGLATVRSCQKVKLTKRESWSWWVFLLIISLCCWRPFEVSMNWKLRITFRLTLLAWK